MIEFNATVLLYLFLALVGVQLIIVLIHLFHSVRYGRFDPLAMISGGIFMIGVVAILWFSVLFLREVDWASRFTLALPSIQLPGL